MESDLPRKQRIITAASAYGAKTPYEAVESARRDLEKQLQFYRQTGPNYVITNLSHHLSEWKQEFVVTVMATLDIDIKD
jgi:hypothetical protein